MARGPAQRLVVEHHHFSGRAPLRVQLDTVGAQLRREPEGGQRVFRGRARRAEPDRPRQPQIDHGHRVEALVAALAEEDALAGAGQRYARRRSPRFHRCR